MLQHDESDAGVVSQQTGRPFRGSWRVAARCHLGLPMVVESHPRLEDGSPFPTLYWLTCPVLVKRASTLESEGWMAAFNDELAANDELRARVDGAVQRYRSARDAHEVIDDSGSPPGGGPERIKCLHAHLAFQLAGGADPVGARTLAETGWPDCIEGCVPGPLQDGDRR